MANEWKRTLPFMPSKDFVSPQGELHHIYYTDDRGTDETEEPIEAASDWRNADGETFTGKDRKAAKTSISDAPIEPYSRLVDLIRTLPDDDFMRYEHTPRITRTADSERQLEEDRNVRVAAWLLASCKEKDNDFHMILGSSPSSDQGELMTAEITGLPKSGEFRQRLTTPRKQFTEYFGDYVPGRTYIVYDQPIRVIVSGSLFYDVDHAPGIVGTGDFKPTTAWEIHPVTDIRFP